MFKCLALLTIKGELLVTIWVTYFDNIHRKCCTKNGKWFKGEKYFIYKNIKTLNHL